MAVGLGRKLKWSTSSSCREIPHSGWQLELPKGQIKWGTLGHNRAVEPCLNVFSPDLCQEKAVMGERW